MDRQDLINTCVFEQFQGLLFSDLSGPLNMNKSVLCPKSYVSNMVSISHVM